MKFVFYDFEVFSNDWMVVLLCEDTEDKDSELVYQVIQNNASELHSFHVEHMEYIWVGYNSTHYDQYILKGLLLGESSYKINQFIIEQGEPGWKYSRDFWRVSLNGYDTMAPLDKGLKYLESSMGLNIQETSVPFNINRALTRKELEETAKYCINDVRQTRIVFWKRYDDFETTHDLVEIINANTGKEDWTLLSKSGTQLAAIMLGAKKPTEPRTDEFDYELPKNLLIEKYVYVVDWYEAPENHRYTVYDEKKKKWVKNQLVTAVAGVEHAFGLGGLHGALPKFNYVCKEDEVLVNCDVRSYYPSALIIYNLLSRNVSDPSAYKQVYDTRVQMKAEKNKKQKAYKLVLNQTSGGMKDAHNGLYDARRNNEMCISCQLYALDLIEHLEAEVESFKLVQTNTDGLFFLVKKSDTDAYMKVCKEWTERTKFELEFEDYRAVYQKDVNNYLIVAEDGHTKAKGAYLKEQSELEREFSIVAAAMTSYMKDGISVEETINQCNSLVEFMYTTKASSKYICAKHGEETLNERCNRVFASIREEDGGIFKVSKLTGKPVKFPNSPLHCFIDNGDIQSAAVPDYLDRQFYIDLAKKRLKDFGLKA